MRGMVWLSLACAAGLAGFPAGITTAQERAAPTDTKGARTEAVSALDVTRAFKDLDGRQLRIRRITVEPGGHLAVHEHTDRPGSASSSSRARSPNTGTAAKRATTAPDRPSRSP